MPGGSARAVRSGAEPGGQRATTALKGHPPGLESAIARARDYLLAGQSPAGYWVGELEGDSILESEYILLLAYLGKGQPEKSGQRIPLTKVSRVGVIELSVERGA